MTSTKFEELERKVRNHKIKKCIKFVLTILLFIGLGVYVFNEKDKKEELSNNPLHVKIVKKQNEKKEEVKVQHFAPIKTITPVKKKEPIKEEKTAEKTLEKAVSYDTIKLAPSINIPNIVTKKETIVEPIIEKKIQKKKIDLHVKEVKSEDALLERYGVAGDYESALGLANLYFEKRKYEKSVYWSKKASKLNSNSPDSWLIYAKSKFELGQKEDAIKSLELYLDYFSSERIEKLLKLYRDEK